MRSSYAAQQYLKDLLTCSGSTMSGPGCLWPQGESTQSTFAFFDMSLSKRESTNRKKSSDSSPLFPHFISSFLYSPDARDNLWQRDCDRAADVRRAQVCLPGRRFNWSHPGVTTRRSPCSGEICYSEMWKIMPACLKFPASVQPGNLASPCTANQPILERLSSILETKHDSVLETHHE